jgi:hypothetical protein
LDQLSLNFPFELKAIRRDSAAQQVLHLPLKAFQIKGPLTSQAQQLLARQVVEVLGQQRQVP